MALLAAKSKLNPVGGQSTPRSEMDGHTLGARGTRTITTALKEVTPAITKVYMIRDSHTILQALESGATPFSEFFANRIGEVYDCIREIQGKVEVILGWVKSSDNAADIASRINATPKDLEEGTVWQDGSAYLKLPESECPLRTDIMSGTVELPSKELRKQYKHLAFQLAAQPVQHDKLEQQVKVRTSTHSSKHELDAIAESTNKRI